MILKEWQQREIWEYLLSLNNDIDMVATFLAESGLNPRAKSPTNDRGLCQLNYQYNSDVIDDPRRSSNDWHWQAEQCVNKWKNVSSKYIRMAYSLRFKYLK